MANMENKRTGRWQNDCQHRKKAKTFFPRCYGDESRSGANPTTSEFTTTTPAL
jgi:hypothetical protein